MTRLAAANPFDILPANLFNIFSTQGYICLQRHYIAILLRIYALAEFNRFGLTREVVIAEIIDYLKNADAETEVAAQISAESNGNGSHPSKPGGSQTTQEYASYLLRRLDETGWIEREQHADYTETIILPNYAFTLLEAFRTIEEQKPREFSGQLYTAHQLLTAASDRDDFSPALAITQAFENVRQVVRGLNELNQNIRRYIEQATRAQEPTNGNKSTISDLLHLQFDDYAETLGPTYHALKTSDHVSRYRRDIVDQLQQWQLDDKWLDRAAEDLATQGNFTPAQANEEIIHAMQFIIHQLEGLDPLLDDIDQRHAQYLRTSLRQIRYQLVSADGSFKDRLINLAKHLDALQDVGETLLPKDAPSLQRHPVYQPDLRSYYTPPQDRGAFIPAEIITPTLRPSELIALRAATLQDVTQALTPEKVNRFVLGFFNGHKKLHANELPPDVLNDLQWLTTIIAYAHHPEVAYGIDSVEGEPVEVGPYRIVPFELEKL
jgi:hypothetical protein